MYQPCINKILRLNSQHQCLAPISTDVNPNKAIIVNRKQTPTNTTQIFRCLLMVRSNLMDHT